MLEKNPPWYKEVILFPDTNKAVQSRLQNNTEIQGDQNVSVHLTSTVQRTRKKYSILNSFNHLT